MGTFWRGAVVGLLFLVAACQSYQSPGGLGVTQHAVDQGQFAMHVVETGVGPTVVFSGGAGINDPYTDLRAVIGPTSKFARAITYERAGYGQSPGVDAPRDVDQRVADLARALTKVGAPGPYILVGHSYASLELLRFAQTHPDQVKGLVLIDGAPPRFYQTYKADDSWLAEILQVFFPSAPGMQQEKLTLKQDAERVIAGGSIGQIPLITFQAGSNGIPDWGVAQQEFADYSQRYSTVVVPDADHFIHRTHGDQIVAAIRSLCVPSP